MSTLGVLHRNEREPSHRPLESVGLEFLIRVACDTETHVVLRRSSLLELAYRQHQDALRISDQLLRGDIEEWFLALEALDLFGGPEATHILIVSLPDVSNERKRIILLHLGRILCTLA